MSESSVCTTLWSGLVCPEPCWALGFQSGCGISFGHKTKSCLFALYRSLAVLLSTSGNDRNHTYSTCVAKTRAAARLNSLFLFMHLQSLESCPSLLLFSARLPAPSHLSEASVSPCPSWPHVCRVSQSIWVQASSQRGGARAGHGLIWPVARPGVRAELGVEAGPRLLYPAD